MGVVDSPMTGPIAFVPAPADVPTYVLLPIVDEPEAFMTVFSDGSYTRWRPES
ncbi:hypothetical protein SEA_SNEK_36 [Arthrobacter phage Snek]|uniref:Uncharacterized protein n=1 Tax=Arthrobacter phage Tweety19 TaxID=2768133 RepID=A0A7G9W234_9CAUD|nr:hypothetical protein PQE19_gp36 [Arthrobacter phage Tweety19]QNO12697.1 hypothetical protein SEA_TWEETY19_36 [Arthrobacter phage Tweety19]